MSDPLWVSICAFEDIYPESGVCALVGNEQVAVFRIRDALYAIGNFDPISGANVLSRGIVGDLGGELVVASPIYKQHFNLTTGKCLEEPERCVPVYDTRIVDGHVWVRGNAPAASAAPPPPPAAAPPARRLVVIGNGVAAMRTLEELIDLDGASYEIEVFGAEPHQPYNRILLSSTLAGEKSKEDLWTHSPQWFDAKGIRLHQGDAVVRIDRIKRVVHSARGVAARYDRLLIATGAEPIVLPLPGRDLPGVMTFRDLSDVEQMLSMASSHQSCIVIGGGLLGLEAASGLALRGMQVTVVHSSEYLMNRQLDPHASGLLRAEMETRGIRFRMSSRTEAILGGERASGVRFSDGQTLPADLIVMTTGITPNIELAQAAGLACGRGILVDDTMQTFDPAIYAVGECVEHRGTTYGLVAPLWEQARVCAAHLAERGVRQYRKSPTYTNLKVSGVSVFAAGDHEPASGRESLVLRDAKRGVYKHLVIENEKLRGAVLYGDTKDGGWYFDLINEGRDIGALRDQLLFRA